MFLYLKKSSLGLKNYIIYKYYMARLILIIIAPTIDNNSIKEDIISHIE